MALTQVTGPYPIFTDLDGTPLDDGYLYIGAINQDPEQNPIQVFWDSNLTIPASQPIRTSNGYAYRNGTPALLYTGGEFSITIRNKREEFVLYSPVGYGFDPAAVSASVVKNDFIGNGVQVAFVLSASPSTILATNIFINGVYQEKDSYSLLGNVITFSIAPPLNSSIEIMTNETGVINGGNANDISYTLTAPGATLQSVQTKLEQYVSVKDFGAVGDGVADDTAAIQDAIAGAPTGSTIYFPAGTYFVTDTILIDVDVSFVGTGEMGSIILAQHSAPNTDVIEIGNVDETRVGVCIEKLGIQFKNTNTRHVINSESFTSKLTIRHVDIRSFGSNIAVIATGAAIRIGGVGTVGGLNDWALIQQCYLAFCTNGLEASGRNIINLRFTQNTTASIRNECVLWTTGGQSQLDNNTFQYSNLNANGTTRAYTIRFEGGVLSDVNNVTLGPGNSFQANGGAGLGPAVPNTWEILVKDATAVNIVGNQFAGASAIVNFGAFHAIEFENSNGWVNNNTFINYNRTGGTDTDPGPCEYDAVSNVSHFNNITDDFTLGGSDFTTASSTAALKTIVSGRLKLEQKSTAAFFDANPVTGITDVSFIRVGGTGLVGKVDFGIAQLGNPAPGQDNVTLSWANPASTKVFCQLANTTATEYLAVNINSGSFDVRSNVASGSFYYWFAIDV